MIGWVPRREYDEGRKDYVWVFHLQIRGGNDEYFACQHFASTNGPWGAYYQSAQFVERYHEALKNPYCNSVECPTCNTWCYKASTIALAEQQGKQP